MPCIVRTTGPAFVRLRAMPRRGLLAAVVVVASLVLGDRAGAATLTLEDAAGTRAPLAAHLGEAAVAVHFWATWCAPCLSELPRLAALLEARPDLAAHIIVVSVDSRPIDGVRAFLAERLGLTLETLRVVDGTPGDTFGVTGYPATLFLAADGTVEALVSGSIDWADPGVVADLTARFAD